MSYKDFYGDKPTTAQDRRTNRCNHCFGTGKMRVHDRPAEVACRCTSATLNPGTRRSGMVAVEATKRGGKHGRRGRTQPGILSRPRKHWRGDVVVPATSVPAGTLGLGSDWRIYDAGTMPGRWTDYSVRKAQWLQKMGRL